MNILLRILILIATSIVFTSCGNSSDSTEPMTSAKPETGMAGDGQLDLIVEYIRKQNGLPAMAAVMVHDEQLIEKSAMGKRSVESNTQVTADDQWHIGSNTKSMTSMVAALLVKEGMIRWDSTIEDIYPELIGIMLPEYQKVRLDELLSHTSGLPSNIPDFDAYFTDQRELNVQRQTFVEKVLVLTSTTTRGVYEYSNIGYITAGAMLERVSGSRWEALMQIYLFDPLAMTQSGFGAPNTQGNLAQPVGHILDDDDNWTPVDPVVEDISDNPPVLGPAGTVHASLDDMAAYIGLHLKGLRGESVAGFLNAQAFGKLYTPFPNSNYGLGWIIDDQVILHDGSNTIWFAIMLINAEKNIALFVVTNAADLEKGEESKASKAVTELLTELGKRADAAFQ